jgi:hypothetical protein
VSDATDVLNAIDVDNDFLHGEIPRVVHDIRQINLGNWDMP